MEILDGLKGKAVVVTGASGYIGSELVNALVKQRCKIIRVSRSDLSPLPDVITIKADICNPDVWSDIVSHADIVYHLAGNTSSNQAASYPVLSLNSTLLPINHLIKAAQEQQRKPRVVFASTATVYGLTSILPVAETVIPNPVSVYDMHKLFAEKQLALATQLGLLEAVSLRLANVYGPSSGKSSAADRGIINSVTSMAIQGKALTLYGDGNYLRDYVYITDVVNAFLLASVSSHIYGESFNIASGIGTLIRHVFSLIASEVGKITGCVVEISSTPWAADISPIEKREFIANINKFKNATNWNPSININQGIILNTNEFFKYKNLI